MKFEVFEYTIKDKKAGTYIGSYTLKANCPKKKELQQKFKSKLVQVFEDELINE